MLATPVVLPWSAPNHWPHWLAFGVAKERLITGGRVSGSGGVVKECLKTIGRVVVSRGVVNERIKTVGRVLRAGGVVKERCLHR